MAFVCDAGGHAVQEVFPPSSLKVSTGHCVQFPAFPVEVVDDRAPALVGVKAQRPAEPLDRWATLFGPRGPKDQFA